jgi:hypothetical protein
VIELRSLMRTMLRSVAICAAVLFLAQRMCCHALAAAETPPNTLITNTASATYTDPTGVVYTVSSNAVSTTVQNAPLLTIAATAAQTVSPGETVIDTFTVTNNGNATGAITLDTPSIAGPGTESNLYVLDGAATGPCSVAAPCSLATLNTQPALTVSAVGTSITVGVIYVASSSATPGSTIATTLSGSIKQAAVGGAPAATSPIATATDTDTVLADARLDLYKTAIPPSSQTAPITYTIEGNNGGGFGAKALVSAGRLLGLPASPGVIAVLDAIPRFAGASTQTTIVSAPPVPALPAGDTGTVYYSTSTDGLSGWSPAFSATANFIALFVTTTNPAGIVFPSDPAGSTGAGVAQSASQFVLTFQITQPVESGAANAGSLKNIANSIIGGNPGGAGTPIIAPRVPVDSSYETATAPVPLSVFANTTINTTPSTGAPAPGGASNVVLTAAFANHEVLNGPLDNAAATGSYNGTVGVSTQNDFTAATFACANGSATATISCTWPAGGVAIHLCGGAGRLYRAALCGHGLPCHDAGHDPDCALWYGLRDRRRALTDLGFGRIRDDDGRHCDRGGAHVRLRRTFRAGKRDDDAAQYAAHLQHDCVRLGCRGNCGRTDARCRCEPNLQRHLSGRSAANQQVPNDRRQLHG